MEGPSRRRVFQSWDADEQAPPSAEPTLAHEPDKGKPSEVELQDWLRDPGTEFLDVAWWKVPDSLPPLPTHPQQLDQLLPQAEPEVPGPNYFIVEAHASYDAAASALAQCLRPGSVVAPTVIEFAAGRLKSSAQGLMLQFLSAGLPQWCEEVCIGAGKWLGLAQQCVPESKAPAFDLLESAPLELVEGMYGVVCNDLGDYLDLQRHEAGVTTALAGRVKWWAQQLLLHYLRSDPPQECGPLMQDVVKLLDCARACALGSSAPEFSLLTSAPAELMKRLAPVQHRLAKGHLDSLLGSEPAHANDLIEPAGILKTWSQWLMRVLSETGRSGECEALIGETLILLNAARMRSSHPAAPEFNLLEPMPDDLRRLLQDHKLLPAQSIVQPQGLRLPPLLQHLQVKGVDLNALPPGASLRPAKPEVQTETVPVGQKRSQGAAGIGEEVRWSAEAEAFIENLEVHCEACIENSTVENFAKFAACGNAAICDVRRDEKLCKEFTQGYLLFCARARKKLGGQLRDGFRLALLNGETPRWVVVILGRAALDYAHETVLQMGMVETIYEAYAMPQAFPDLDRDGVERAFRPSGGWPAMPRFDGMRLIERFGEPWSDLLHCIKVLRTKLTNNYTSERIIGFAEYCTAAICFLDQHAGPDACDKFTRQYLDICVGICGHARKSLGTTAPFDELFLNPAHTPRSVVSALDRARRTAEPDLLACLKRRGISTAIEQAVEKAACKPRTWDQFLKLVRPGIETGRRIDEISARVAMRLPPIW